MKAPRGRGHPPHQIESLVALGLIWPRVFVHLVSRFARPGNKSAGKSAGKINGRFARQIPMNEKSFRSNQPPDDSVGLRELNEG